MLCSLVYFNRGRAGSLSSLSFPFLSFCFTMYFPLPVTTTKENVALAGLQLVVGSVI
jgi:hypothetical protein